MANTLKDQRNITIDCLPYPPQISNFFGTARIDKNGTVIESQRTDNQWRRVRYSYMDAHRYANQRGLTLRGSQKVWDLKLAALGPLW